MISRSMRVRPFDVVRMDRQNYDRVMRWVWRHHRDEIMERAQARYEAIEEHVE